MRAFVLSAAAALLAIVADIGHTKTSATTAAYGITSRTVPKPYLHMPTDAAGKLPSLLSQTGVFKDTRNLVVADGLIPYDLVVAFWSDGANKLRWAAVPDGGGKIEFSPTGDWVFPAGSVFVKTFELPVDETHPEVTRRLETRLLVRNASGGVYGVVYKWRPDNSDADLLSLSRGCHRQSAAYMEPSRAFFAQLFRRRHPGLPEACGRE